MATLSSYRAKPPDWIIGVDESGTGAFAGPFTVCAFMSHSDHTEWIASLGAKDSKKLTHDRRRRLVDALAPCAKIADIVVVPPNYSDQKKVWREAIARAVKHCLSVLDMRGSRVSIEIDGAHDGILEGYFMRTWGLTPKFIVKGDSLIPQISAASIFAKVVRTELMAEAHKRYPMYGWCNASGHGNDGYGVEGHMAAIEKYGICELHRRVRPLLPYFSGA